MSQLVPAQAQPLNGRSQSLEGRFVCVQQYALQPPQEDASCAGDGYSVSARVIFASEVSQPLIPQAVIDPVVFASSWSCGLKTRTLTANDLALLARVLPDLAGLPLTSSDAIPSSTPACRDPRIELTMPRRTRHQLEAGVHRLSLAEGSGEVVVRVSGQEVGRWGLGLAEIPDVCTQGGLVPVRWQVDLEVICSGELAIVSAARWRPFENPPCFNWSYASSVRPFVVPCDPLTLSQPEYVLEDASRWRVKLANGAAERISPPDLDYRPLPSSR